MINKQIAQAQRRRAQQIRHHSEQISIATAVVQHRLDPDLLFDQTAVASALMRDCARAPSGMFTPSTPASFKQSNRIERLLRVDAFRRQHFDRSYKLARRDLACPVRTLFRRHDFDVRRRQLVDREPVAPDDSTTCCARGEAARTASEINLMCAGVVPQQPPINFAPD